MTQEINAEDWQDAGTDRKSVDALLKRITKIAAQREEHFSEEEIKQLIEILEYRDEIVAQFRYKRARQLIFREYRALVIAIGATLAFILATWDNIKRLLEVVGS